jgi:hypothetical protein
MDLLLPMLVFISMIDVVFQYIIIYMALTETYQHFITGSKRVQESMAKIQFAEVRKL